MIDVFYGDVGDDGRGFAENNLWLRRFVESGGLGALAIWVPCPDFFCIRQTPLVSGVYLDLWMATEAASMLSQGAPLFFLIFYFSR